MARARCCTIAALLTLVLSLGSPSTTWSRSPPRWALCFIDAALLPGGPNAVVDVGMLLPLAGTSDNTTDEGIKRWQSREYLAGFLAAVTSPWVLNDSSTAVVRGHVNFSVKLHVRDVQPATTAAEVDAKVLDLVRTQNVVAMVGSDRQTAAAAARITAAYDRLHLAPREIAYTFSSHNTLHLRVPLVQEFYTLVQEAAGDPLLLVRWGLIVWYDWLPPMNATMDSVRGNPQHEFVVGVRQQGKLAGVPVTPHEIGLNETNTAPGVDLYWIPDAIYAIANHAQALFVMLPDMPGLAARVAKAITSHPEFESVDTFVFLPFDAQSATPNSPDSGAPNVMIHSHVPNPSDHGMLVVREYLRDLAVFRASGPSAWTSLFSTAAVVVPKLSSNVNGSLPCMEGYLAGRWLVELLRVNDVAISAVADAFAVLSASRILAHADAPFLIGDVWMGPVAPSGACATRRGTLEYDRPCPCLVGPRSVYAINPKLLEPGQEAASTCNLDTSHRRVTDSGKCISDGRRATLSRMLIGMSSTFNNTATLNARFDQCMSAVAQSMAVFRVRHPEWFQTVPYGIVEERFDPITFFNHADRVYADPASEMLHDIDHRFNAILTACNAYTHEQVNNVVPKVMVLGMLADGMALVDDSPGSNYRREKIDLFPTYADFAFTAATYIKQRVLKPGSRSGTGATLRHHVAIAGETSILLRLALSTFHTLQMNPKWIVELSAPPPSSLPTVLPGLESLLRQRDAVAVTIVAQSAMFTAAVILSILSANDASSGAVSSTPLMLLVAPEDTIAEALIILAATRPGLLVGGEKALSTVAYVSAFKYWPSIKTDHMRFIALTAYIQSSLSVAMSLSASFVDPFSAKQFVDLFYSGAVIFDNGLAFGPLDETPCADDSSNVTTSSKLLDVDDVLSTPWKRPQGYCQCAKGVVTFHLRALSHFARLVTSMTTVPHNDTSAAASSTKSTDGEPFLEQVLFTLRLPDCGVRWAPYLTPLDVPLIAGASSAGAVVLVILTAVIFVSYRQYRRFIRLRYAPCDEAQFFTVVFTDIESSTPLWALEPEAMSAALERHHEMIRELIDEYHGYEVKTIGDSFMVAFTTARQAVVFSRALQRRFFAEVWDPRIDEYYRQFSIARGIPIETVATDVSTAKPAAMPYDTLWNGLRVRIGIHTGKGQIIHDVTTETYDYYGTVVNTSARVESVGHGGQLIVTGDTLFEIGVLSPPEAEGDAQFDDTHQMVVTFLGSHTLRGLDGPVQLFALSDDAFAFRPFPPLRLGKAAEVENLDHVAERSTGADSESRSSAATNLTQRTATTTSRDSTASTEISDLADRLYQAAAKRMAAPSVVESTGEDDDTQGFREAHYRSRRQAKSYLRTFFVLRTLLHGFKREKDINEAVDKLYDAWQAERRSRFAGRSIAGVSTHDHKLFVLAGIVSDTIEIKLDRLVSDLSSHDNVSSHSASSSARVPGDSRFSGRPPPRGASFLNDNDKQSSVTEVLVPAAAAGAPRGGSRRPDNADDSPCNGRAIPHLVSFFGVPAATSQPDTTGEVANDRGRGDDHQSRQEPASGEDHASPIAEGNNT